MSLLATISLVTGPFGFAGKALGAKAKLPLVVCVDNKINDYDCFLQNACGNLLELSLITIERQLLDPLSGFDQFPAFGGKFSECDHRGEVWELELPFVVETLLYVLKMPSI